MGFRPAARANRPAFWGSAASSLYFVLTETGLQDAEMSVVRERLTLVREIEVIHTYMLTVQNVVPDDIAIAQSFEATFNSFGGQEMANGLQKLLMKLVDDSLDRARRYRAPRALIARANACKARGASAWLMTIPHPDYPELRISNLDFRLAVRHRMGLLPSDTMPAHCACGRQIADMDYHTQVSHFHGCPYQKRRGMDMRHGFVRDALTAILREAGTPCLSEDHYRDHDWPDVEIFFPPCPSLPVPRVICDVAVTCPTTRSSLRRAHTQLSCATRMQEIKVNRYRHLTMEAGATVATSLPLVFESYGGLAPLSVILLGQAVRAYAHIHNAPMTPLEFSRRLRQRLSIALQRGNALIAKLGLGLSWRQDRRPVRLNRARRLLGRHGRPQQQQQQQQRQSLVGALAPVNQESNVTATRGVTFQVAVTGPPSPVESESSSTESGPGSGSASDSDSD